MVPAEHFERVVANCGSEIAAEQRFAAVAVRAGVRQDLGRVVADLDGQSVGVPKDSPAEIIEMLNKEINAGLADPKLKARMADLGVPMPMAPVGFGRFIAEETEKWGKVVKFVGIKAD